MKFQNRAAEWNARMMLKQLMDGGDDGCDDDNVKREEHVEGSHPPFSLARCLDEGRGGMNSGRKK